MVLFLRVAQRLGPWLGVSVGRVAHVIELWRCCLLCVEAKKDGTRQMAKSQWQMVFWPV